MHLHRLLHQLRLQFMISLSPHSENFFMGIFILAFALVFFVVGIMRLVEFRGVGFGRVQLTSFYILHVIGCVSFSTGLVIFAIDPHMIYRTVMAILFGLGLFILAPLQIYLALVRRVQAPSK